MLLDQLSLPGHGDREGLGGHPDLVDLGDLGALVGHGGLEDLGALEGSGDPD